MKAAYRAYQHEEHYYREDLLDWEDLRNVEQRLQESPKMAWCHGWGGIAMARLNALKYVEENFRVELEKIRGFIEQKLKDADAGKKISLKNSLCLCHGTLGNLALLVHMKKEGEEIRQLQYFIMEKIGNEEENMNKWVGLQECGDYGLVGGITGIGYSCLCGMGKVLELLYIS